MEEAIERNEHRCAVAASDGYLRRTNEVRDTTWLDSEERKRERERERVSRERSIDRYVTDIDGYIKRTYEVT
jgi:hypothetical protein